MFQLLHHPIKQPIFAYGKKTPENQRGRPLFGIRAEGWCVARQKRMGYRPPHGIGVKLSAGRESFGRNAEVLKNLVKRFDT